MRIQLQQRMPRPADAIPHELISSFFNKMKNIATFWYDMHLLTLSLGLRNSEARLLKRTNIKLKKDKVILFDEKQVKSWIKKNALSSINQELIILMQDLIQDEAKKIGDVNRAIIADITNNEKELFIIAKKVKCTRKLKKLKKTFIEDNLPREIAKFTKSKLRPTGRIINISKNEEIKKILKKRVKQAALNKKQYLFNRSELKSNRAQDEGDQGDNPVTRQTVYNVVNQVKQELIQESKKFENILNNNFVSLHSLRKRTVQDIANKYDLFSASRWIGHGSGKGDIKTTQLYLNTSKEKDIEVNDFTAELNKEFIN